MFGNMIVIQSNYILISIDYQLGFKTNYLNINCSFVLKLFAHYHNNKGSNLSFPLHDASQAFDRVQNIKSF